MKTSLTRSETIQLMRVQGFHGDTTAWTRTYCESRVTRAVANAAYAAGVQDRKNGFTCSCPDCRKAA